MEACEGCGLQIAGGTQGCQALFDQFRLRESTELATTYGSTRLTIDVYCLQHPDRYCVSAKSLAAHLTGVGWALERGASEWGLGALRRWLDGPLPLVKPAIPERRGALTVADLAGVVDASEYLAALDAWARSTWAAYSELHDVARRWIDEAIARAG
jgi:uncharacterized protein DUF5946